MKEKKVVVFVREKRVRPKTKPLRAFQTRGEKEAAIYRRIGNGTLGLRYWAAIEATGDVEKMRDGLRSADAWRRANWSRGN